MDSYQEQEVPKNNRNFFAIVIVATIVIGAFVYSVFWYRSLTTILTIPENYTTVFTNAIHKADPSVIKTLPPASALPDKTEEDAEKLFIASRVSAVFDFGNRTSAYLVRILDSKSPEFEPYKSIAAYFLVHSFYDSKGDVVFMANAVKSSRFMDNVSKKAEEVFPGLFAIPFDKMTYSEKSLYLASYLIAVSDRNDSVAIPGNAALELSRAYIQMNKYPNSSLYRTVSTSTIERELHIQLDTVLNRLGKREQDNYTEQTGFFHDTVAGLNLTSLTIDNLRLFGLSNVFPETKIVNTEANFARSYSITKDNVPSLYMFTNYLYARHMALFSENTPENNVKIEELVKNMIGLPPYKSVIKYSWINKTMDRVNNGDGIYGFYTVKNISSIAKRSKNFKEFLKNNGYSYVIDSAI